MVKLLPNMLKKFFKKLATVSVLGVILLPAQFVQASTLSADATGKIVNNVLSATSVDLHVDVDLEIQNETMAQPIVMHVDGDGEIDDESNSTIDLGFSSTDQNGIFQETAASIITTSNTVYFSENGGDWYFSDYNISNTSQAQEDIEQGIKELSSGIQELFNAGVVEYKMEGIGIINKKMTVRYGYTVNNDRLIAYLLDKGVITSDQVDEYRESPANTVAIRGNFWIDTAAMLPVMFTLNIEAKQGDAAYTKLNVSVLFNSFNQAVKIVEPKNAIDIKNYTSSASEDVIASSIVNAAVHIDSDFAVNSTDSDNDGVSNSDEETVWFTNPYNSDSDADGYLDNTEVINGYNPNGTGKLDSDNDGLTDYAEITKHWTDRYDSDSDNDGYNDGLEIANGYNPNGTGRW